MKNGWLRSMVYRSSRPRSTSARRQAFALMERLEPRDLLAITFATLSPSAGISFTGPIAALSQSDVTGPVTQIGAAISWGDGQSTPGTVRLVGTDLQVQGAHTYAAAGQYRLRITVTGSDLGQVSGQETLTVAKTEIALAGGTITPSLGQPFTGTVATFHDAYMGLTASSYSAVITWGDGHNTPGGILSNGAGGYNVVGSNTYTSAPAAGAARVQVVRSIDAAMASADVNVLVNAPAAVTTFGGGLDPSSDTGVSNSDGITSIDQPTFRGTAPAYAIVQLMARAQGQSQLVSLGQTVAGAEGTWTLTAMPILDGIYQIFANVAPPNGLPVQVVPLSTNSQIVIDTVGPSVVSVRAARGQARVQASFQDHLSGLDLASLSDPTNYTLIGPHPWRITASGVALVPSSTVLTNDPQMVSINARATFPVTGIRIVAGGVKDIAGNPLNGKYAGTLPSGGHPQGTSFLYHFSKPVNPTNPAARAQARRTSRLARRTGRTWPH